MSNLPIVHMTLYKHGVGYFRRRGSVEGQSLTLTFKREEMADLLKSLTVLDLAGGQVRGVDYDTPQSQSERLTGCSVILDDLRSLRDLLIALRGRQVQLRLNDGSTIAGTLLGLDEVKEKAAMVPILEEGTETVMIVALERIEGVELRDETAAADLRFFLKTALGQESHRSITVRLSPGSHDLEISYIAPAPTWRVSYRLVLDKVEPETNAPSQPQALLQGWGIFDNRLEEDLTDISLSLTAGMPISFIYDLYTPHTPERPVVEEEDRTAAAPVLFAAGAENLPAAPMPAMPRMQMADREVRRSMMSTGALADAVDESTASGKELGELFQYNVTVPVTVGRGQSAMVPIVNSPLQPNKELIYNRAKMATHPVATLRFKNSTGLTLERGPVTVLEQGEYVGEAVLPFTTDKAEAVVAYAVELGVHITEEHQTDQHLHGLEIQGHYLIRQLYNVHSTLYRIENRTPQTKIVLLERPRNHHFQPFNTPNPAEETLETRRYKIEAGAGQLLEFTVHERRMQSIREDLQKQSIKGLQQYLEGKFLDKQTYNSLEALLHGWDEIAKLQAAIAEQENKRQSIYKSQEMIQKNMAALAKDGEEGRLRGRYVTQLGQSEEELTEIKTLIATIRTEIKDKETQIEAMIAALNPAEA